MCYIWLLMVSLLFYLVAFMSSPMDKWCNIEMVPVGGLIMVRQFQSGDFSIDCCWSEFFFGLNSPPGNCLKRNFLGQPPGKFVPEDNTWKTTGKKFVQGDVLG